MTYKTEVHKFPAFYSGTKRELVIHKFGSEKTDRKVYLQANLHADEAPGVLVLHHLFEKLKKADANGDIEGQIIVVPSANPVGLSQWSTGQLNGRFDNSSGINFNRDFPDVTDDVARKIEGKLTQNPEDNIRLIRQTIKELLNDINPETESGYLKKLLFSMAYDADIVLDLHCDFEGVCHVYMGTPLWEDAKDLSKEVGSVVTLLAEASGGDPFDEACSKSFWELAQKFPDFPIPCACLSATIELRGRCNVNHETAENDAKNILSFLKRRGHVKGEPNSLPELLNDATLLSAVQQITAEDAGVIVYFKEPGDKVEKGEVIAEIVNAIEQRVTKVYSETDGVLFTRRANRLAHVGLILGRVAGQVPLEGKGKFLLSP